MFDFEKITVGELDAALEYHKMSKEMRAVIAKASSEYTEEELEAMSVKKYTQLVNRFLREALNPVATDPN